VTFCGRVSLRLIKLRSSSLNHIFGGNACINLFHFYLFCFYVFNYDFIISAYVVDIPDLNAMTTNYVMHRLFHILYSCASFTLKFDEKI